MASFLPDTGLSSAWTTKVKQKGGVSVNTSVVYVYGQIVAGTLVESQGVLGGKDNIYMFQQRNHVLSRDNTDDIDPPKFFTPLAATILENARHLFYLNDKNIVCGVRHDGEDWVANGIEKLGIEAAAYSQLATICWTRPGSPYNAISIYYQSSKGSGNGIEMISTSTKPGKTWGAGVPDLTPDPPPPQPAPVVRDPPLHGTALTAIKARSGYGIKLNTVDHELPIVYLQWDNLGLAHAQGKEVEAMSTLNIRFAPHTSLTAVDDGANIFCFYTSSRTGHLRRAVLDGSSTEQPIDVSPTPTPKSAITAVSPNSDKIILFFQSLDDDAGTVDLYGVTFTKPTTSAKGAWLQSKETKIV